jgi:hypothetical protein
MLVRRFGIPTALGIAGIPVIILELTYLSVLRFPPLLVFVGWVGGYFFTWIAFAKLNGKRTW